MPGLSVEASFKLSASLDANTREMARVREALAEQAAILTPVWMPINAADTSASSGNLTLDLGGPPQGYVWELRSCSVAGTLPTTAVNGSAYLYRSNAGKSQVPTSSMEWLDLKTTLPAWGFYGAGDLYIRYPENLYVVIVTPSASTLYIAGATVLSRIDTPTARTSTSV